LLGYKKPVCLALVIFFAAIGPLHAESPHSFDHSTYTEILTKFVGQNGRVDYQGLGKSPGELEGYLESLEQVGEDIYTPWSDDEKIAFWINAYNAFTLKVILEHYPIRRRGVRGWAYPANSIRQIPKVWSLPRAKLLGSMRSLDEMEHQILRVQFSEPRIHMALVCAAIGCPPLRGEAYEGVRLHEQLEDQARIFLKQDQNFRLDREEKTAYFSSIFKWFGQDFKQGASGFIARYLPRDDAAFLKTQVNDFEFLKYDWTLNES